MNIAFLLTGQIRLTHDVIENIKFLLSDLRDCDVDFFCSSWYEDNVDCKQISKLFDFKVFDLETYNQYTTQFIQNYENFQLFCESYKTDDQLYNLYSEQDRLRGSWKNVPLVFYKFHRGMQLVNKYSTINNKKYDLVIRTRWDAQFLNPLYRRHVNEVLHNNKLAVYVHSFDEYNKFGVKHPEIYNIDTIRYHGYLDGWVDDTVYYGSPSIMNDLCNVYHSYYEISVSYNCWIIHMILKKYLFDRNLETIRPQIMVNLRGNRIYHYYNE